MDEREFEKTPVLACVANRVLPPDLNERSEPHQTPTAFKSKNRRQWVRWPCDLEAFCQPHPVGNDKLWWLGRIRKISRGGLRLLLSLRLEVGAVVEVEIHTSTGPFCRTVSARIVHAGPMKYGGWTYGCALLEVINDQELRGLLS